VPQQVRNAKCGVFNLDLIPRFGFRAPHLSGLANGFWQGKIKQTVADIRKAEEISARRYN
jgi:hypothetical protein